MEYIIVVCPHCNLLIQILYKEINCKIFRHGIYKSNFTQIHPHLSKEECELLIREKKIIGCGKPFEIKQIGNEWNAYKCDYI